MHALKAAGQETCGSHLDLGTVLFIYHNIGGTKGTFFPAEKK